MRGGTERASGEMERVGALDHGGADLGLGHLAAGIDGQLEVLSRLQ